MATLDSTKKPVSSVRRRSSRAPPTSVAGVTDELRRRSVGAPAARSVLLTILGEYVLPRSGSIWQETLVGALGALGYTPAAARQALSRSARDNWLSVERKGRRARMSLTRQTAGLLRAGAERIYTFGAPWDWNERWLLVALRVPEDRREVRHRARTQLNWAGLGSLGGGLWLTPHVEREGELATIAAAEPEAEILSFKARIGDVGDPENVIDAAWDLTAVAEAYRAFIDDFGRLRPSSSEAFFRNQTAMVHAWRKFPFLDPDLPEQFLPHEWPKARAHKLFHERHSAWKSGAIEFFESLDR